MKKIISILLLMIFCLSFILSGCEKKTYVDFNDDDDGPVNFYGATFILMSQWAYEFKDKKGYTTTVDRQLERYKELESENNCHIEIVQTSNTKSYILAGGLTGANVTDLADLNGLEGYDLYKAGFLYSMDDIPNIDPEEEKWGSKGFKSSACFDGQYYGFLNYYWENVPQFDGAVFYNAILGDELGLVDPHEFVENNEWTWANFSSQVALGTRNVDESKCYGLLYEKPESICQAAIFSNGGEIVKQTDSGYYVSGLSSSESVEALEFIADLNQKGYIGGNFSDNTAVYFVGESFHGTLNSSQTTDQFSVTMEKYGLLMFPYGPSGNSETVSGYTYFNRRLFFFPTATTNQPDEVGLFTNMLFEHLPDSPEDGWRSIAGDQYFHYDQDFENFVYSVENCNYDFSIQLYDAYEDLVKAYSSIIDGSASVGNALSSIEDKFTETIDIELNGK